MKVYKELNEVASRITWWDNYLNPVEVKKISGDNSIFGIIQGYLENNNRDKKDYFFLNRMINPVKPSSYTGFITFNISNLIKFLTPSFFLNYILISAEKKKRDMGLKTEDLVGIHNQAVGLLFFILLNLTGFKLKKIYDDVMAKIFYSDAINLFLQRQAYEKTKDEINEMAKHFASIDFLLYTEKREIFKDCSYKKILLEIIKSNEDGKKYEPLPVDEEKTTLEIEEIILGETEKKEDILSEIAQLTALWHEIIPGSGNKCVCQNTDIFIHRAVESIKDIAVEIGVSSIKNLIQLSKLQTKTDGLKESFLFIFEDENIAQKMINGLFDMINITNKSLIEQKMHPFSGFCAIPDVDI